MKRPEDLVGRVVEHAPSWVSLCDSTYAVRHIWMPNPSRVVDELLFAATDRNPRANIYMATDMTGILLIVLSFGFIGEPRPIVHWFVRDVADDQCRPGRPSVSAPGLPWRSCTQGTTPPYRSKPDALITRRPGVSHQSRSPTMPAVDANGCLLSPAGDPQAANGTRSRGNPRLAC